MRARRGGAAASTFTVASRRKPASCAPASIRSTPGKIGKSGKWSASVSSVRVTHFTPRARSPGTTSVTRSRSSQRISERPPREALLAHALDDVAHDAGDPLVRVEHVAHLAHDPVDLRVAH